MTRVDDRHPFAGGELPDANASMPEETRAFLSRLEHEEQLEREREALRIRELHARIERLERERTAAGIVGVVGLRPVPAAPAAATATEEKEPSKEEEKESRWTRIEID